MSRPSRQIIVDNDMDKRLLATANSRSAAGSNNLGLYFRRADSSDSDQAFDECFNGDPLEEPFFRKRLCWSMRL